MLSSASSVAASVGSSVVVVRRRNVSVREETKIGERPGRPGGSWNRGRLVLVVDSSVAVSSSSSSLVRLVVRRRCSWRRCLSRRRARNGLGRRMFKPEMIEGLMKPSSVSSVGEGEMSEARVMVDDAKPLDELDEADGRGNALLPLLRNLLPPRLNRLALLRTRLLDPKVGVGRMSEAGVAIRVGVTSLRVMMATVVRERPRGRVATWRVRLKNGLITGVKVRVLAEESLEEAEVRTTASSMSSKESVDEEVKVGVTETGTSVVGSTSPDSSSGVLVTSSTVADVLGLTELKDGLWVKAIGSAVGVGARLSWSVTEAGSTSVRVSS